MNKSDSIAALSAALAKAQGELENANKNANNPHFKSKYADLAELLNTVRPVMSKHGLAVVQMPSFEQGVASVETLLTHSSGEYISSICSAPVTKQDAQGVGSAITYLRRYSLAAFCGIAQEDDDVNSAVGNKNQTQDKRAPAPQSAKQTLTDERFKAACESVTNGTFSKIDLLNKFELTTEQRNHANSL